MDRTVINEYMILNNSSKHDQPMSVTNVCAHGVSTGTFVDQWEFQKPDMEVL